MEYSRGLVIEVTAIDMIKKDRVANTLCGMIY